MSKNIVSIAILITLITLISRVTGFFRDVVLAAHYGATIETDAFIMGQSIIGVITSIVFAALGTTFIPVMSDYILNKTKSQTNKFINSIYTLTISLTLVLFILCMIFARQLVKLFAPSFSDEAFILTVELLQIMLPMMVLAVIVTLNNAKLQNHNRFLAPASVGIPLNLCLILTMVFFSDYSGIHGLAWAMVAGTLLQIAFQYLFARKLGYRYKIDFDLKEEGVRRVGILVVPIMIGSGIQQINTLVDQMLASGLAEGSIAALNYANLIGLFLIGLLSATVVSIYYTSMSNYFSAGENELFKKLLRNTINISVILIVPASVGFMILRVSIVQLIFERGAFDSEATTMTATALLFYTVGLVGFLLRDVLSRAFYALKDTKTAMINGSMAVVMNILLSIILVRYLDLGGLALATSLSGIISTILLMFSLHKKIGDFGLRDILIKLIKVLLASSFMGVSVHYFYKFIYTLFNSNPITLLMSLGVGIGVYLVSIIILKIEEASMIKQLIRSKLKIQKQGLNPSDSDG